MRVTAPALRFAQERAALVTGAAVGGRRSRESRKSWGNGWHARSAKSCMVWGLVLGPALIPERCIKARLSLLSLAVFISDDLSVSIHMSVCIHAHVHTPRGTVLCLTSLFPVSCRAVQIQREYRRRVDAFFGL